MKSLSANSLVCLSPTTTLKQFLSPKQGTSSKDISLCLIARVVSDKAVNDHAFSSSMLGYWNMEPSSIIEPLTKGHYLITLASKHDYLSVLQGGPWFFRQDLVAIAMVFNHADLINPKVNSAPAWMQIHGLPPALFNEDGILEIASQVAQPLSPIHTAFINGRMFYKVKVDLQLESPIIDTRKVTFNSQTEFPVYFSYEKFTRICMFCGLLGHLRGLCPDYSHLLRLSLMPQYAARQDLNDLLKKAKGPWMINPALVPRPTIHEKLNPHAPASSSTLNPPTKKHPLRPPMLDTTPTHNSSLHLMQIDLCSDIDVNRAAKKAKATGRQLSPPIREYPIVEL